MATEFSKLLGKKIRYYRELKGLTQAELAEKVGCEPSTIGHIEIGKNLPSTSKIEQISRVLDTPAYNFFIDNNFECDSNIMYKITELLKSANKKQLSIIYDLVSGILNLTSHN